MKILIAAYILISFFITVSAQSTSTNELYKRDTMERDRTNIVKEINIPDTTQSVEQDKKRDRNSEKQNNQNTMYVVPDTVKRKVNK